MKLVGLLPTDASVLQRLAELHLAEGDEAAAAQYYNDAYRYFPSNMDVIQWLGAHYLKAQFYEKAISFFERAAIIQYGIRVHTLKPTSYERKSCCSLSIN